MYGFDQTHLYCYNFLIVKDKWRDSNMSKAEAKTIRLLLNDGDLDGIIRMQDSKWNVSVMRLAIFIEIQLIR